MDRRKKTGTDVGIIASVVGIIAGVLVLIMDVINGDSPAMGFVLLCSCSVTLSTLVHQEKKGGE